MSASVDDHSSTRSDDIAARLERFEAHEAIRRLVHDYSHGFDKRDLDRFLAVWAEDGVWSAGPGHEVVGRPAIREAVGAMWSQLSATHHWSCNSVIDVHGVEAVAMTDVHAVAQGDDGGWTQTAATYRDRFVRVDATWLLARRATDIHRAFPIAEPLS